MDMEQVLLLVTSPGLNYYLSSYVSIKSTTYSIHSKGVHDYRMPFKVKIHGIVIIILTSQMTVREDVRSQSQSRMAVSGSKMSEKY